MEAVTAPISSPLSLVKPRRRAWVLRPATGDPAEVSHRGGLFTATNCVIGDLSKAVAPQFAPQRYFTLTIADQVLNHPDRDALVAALAWISEMTIADRITRSQRGAGN